MGVERETLSPAHDEANLGHVTLWGTKGPRAWITARPGLLRERVLTTGKVKHAQNTAKTLERLSTVSLKKQQYKNKYFCII